MASGGARTGVPGASYSQRTDMQQSPRAATGQTYGTAKAQTDAQKAQPLPAAGARPFLRPSERPDEPITAGMPTGPGPGPEVLPRFQNPAGPSTVDQLRALYSVWPSEDLRALLERVERSGQ